MRASDAIGISHVGLRTPDLESMRRYYCDVLGLWEIQRDADGVVHLTAGGVGADIELIPAADVGLDHVALHLDPSVDIAAVGRDLDSQSLPFKPWERCDPGMAAGLGVEDPEGNHIQLVIPDNEFPEFRTGAGIRPRKLGHLATRVRDSAEIRSFYEQTFGFRFSDANEHGVVFLRCNADHHALNFIEATRPGNTHHIAFELEDDFAHVQRAGDVLERYDLPLLWGPGRHGPGHSIFTYHRDPDGHVIELFNQLDRMSDERQGYFDPRPWHPHRPQRPRVWSLGDRSVGGMVPPRPEGFWE